MLMYSLYKLHQVINIEVCGRVGGVEAVSCVGEMIQQGHILAALAMLMYSLYKLHQVINIEVCGRVGGGGGVEAVSCVGEMIQQGHILAALATLMYSYKLHQVINIVGCVWGRQCHV